jgi:hypothetical protein
MSDMEAISNVLERVAQFESELGRIRGGRKPAPAFDLLTWTAGTLPTAAQARGAETSAGLLDIVRRTLQDDWHGLVNTVAAWAARIDERFAR